MNNKILSHDELQHIEYANKLLKEHQQVVTAVVNETEDLMNNYIPILKGYIQVVHGITVEFGDDIKNVINSSRQLKIVTGGTQEIIHFMDAVKKLDALLTPEFIEKIRRVSRDDG